MAQIDLNRELFEQMSELKRIRKQAIRKGRVEIATSASAQLLQLAKLIAGFAQAQQDKKDAKQQAKTGPSEVRFVVRYENDFEAMTPEQVDGYISMLLKRRAEREGTPEVLLAAMARVISELEGEPLPPEMEAEVRRLLDLTLNGDPHGSGHDRTGPSGREQS